jgi:hypothetical protein
MRLSTLAVAIDARQLLATKGWTQPTGPSRSELCRARLANGDICSHLNPKAARWSLSGAVLAACRDDGEDMQPRHPAAVELFAALKKHLAGKEPSAWANEPGRWAHEVIAAVDAVITQLRQEVA